MSNPDHLKLMREFQAKLDFVSAEATRRENDAIREWADKIVKEAEEHVARTTKGGTPHVA